MSEKLFNVGIKAMIRRGDKLLIVRDTEGRWEMPGGRMDANETVEQTLRRELGEELPNIKSVQIHDIMGAYRIHKDIKPDVSLALIFYKVTAEFEGGEPELSDEHEEYRWATKEEAIEIAYDKYKDAIEKAYQ